MAFCAEKTASALEKNDNELHLLAGLYIDVPADLTDILLIDEDLTLLKVVESEQQSDYRALTGAARPD